MRGMVHLIVGIAILCCTYSSAGIIKYAGCRQSSYGTSQSDADWVKIFKNMASYFPQSTPTGIWIVGTLGDGGVCNLEFPGGSITNATFESSDWHEGTLDHFDQAGVKVFLQAESGYADINQLIDAILNQYKHHPCVLGYAVDVEWYDNVDGEGTPVTDPVAQTWEQRVKSHNSAYRLGLKHWEVEYMPPTYRGDIIFINDGQEMESLWRLQEYFYKWGREYRGNTVFYQGGYIEDYDWWGALSNPPKDICDALAEVINSDQEMGMMWVDFTLDYEEVDGLFDSDFTPSKLKVKTTALNPGTITLSPAGGEYDHGTQVTATAKPNPMALFRSWAGDVSGTDASVTFTVTKNMNIDALFGYNLSTITDMLEDCEDGDNLNILGGEWFTGDDSYPDSGMTGSSIITPNPGSEFVMTAGGISGSNYAAKVNYTIDNGTLNYHGHVKFGCELNKTGPDLGDATGLSFYHKGSTCKVQYETAEVVDTAYYFTFVKEHTDWTLVVVDLSTLKQPTDFGKVVPFHIENGTAVSWEMMDRNGINEDVWIDDVRLTGVQFEVITESKQNNFSNSSVPVSMKVYNKTLQVSYTLPENRQVNIAVINTAGKLVKEIFYTSSNKGKQSAIIDISSLASGLYIVTLQCCEKGSELFHRKFIYTH